MQPLEPAIPRVRVALSLQVPSRGSLQRSGLPGQGGPGPGPRVPCASEPCVGGWDEVTHLNVLVISRQLLAKAPGEQEGRVGSAPWSQTSFLQREGQLAYDGRAGCLGLGSVPLRLV